MHGIDPTPSNGFSATGWEEFLGWARLENLHQRAIAGVHGADHPIPDLRGRTYFEVNLYRYFHAWQVCQPYLSRPNQKVLDVGSWPGAWLRVIAQFARPRPEIWATGLMFPDQFLEKMAGACQGIFRCELDPRSPLRDSQAPTTLPLGNFNFVSAMEVVEHLYHPPQMFRTVHDALAPGGVLFITTNNVNRLSNLTAILTGGGLAGNLAELAPQNGGILGNWRPHMREYAWRELRDIAGAAGFRLLSHGFYQENYGRRLLEGTEQPSDGLIFEQARERELARRIRPLLDNPDQLKPGMHLVFQRS